MKVYLKNNSMIKRILAGMTILFWFSGFSQYRDFQIKAFDISKRNNNEWKINFNLDTLTFGFRNTGSSERYTFKHNPYGFGQNTDTVIHGDIAFDHVVYEKQKRISIRKHVIREASFYYEKDSIRQLLKILPPNQKKTEDLLYGLNLRFYYVKNNKGNWCCFIPNGEYIWLYEFKKTNKSSLTGIHSEFLGIIIENCRG